MDANWLFLNVLNELRSYFANGDRYSSIRATGLLRQLVVDANSLVDQVNRPLRLRLRCRVWGPSQIEGVPGVPEPVFAMRQSFPEGPPFPTVELTIPKYLDRLCFRFSGERYTVREVIKICAEKQGAVHYESKLDKRSEQLFQALWQSVSVEGREADVYMVRDIIKCVLQALGPLEDEVRRRV